MVIPPARRVGLTLLVLLFATLPLQAAAGQGSGALRELTLEASIQLALQGSLLVKSAGLQKASAVAKVDEAAASAYPKLGLTSSYTRLSEGMPSLAGEGPKDNYAFRLSVTQPVYTGGLLTAALQAAKASLQAADLDLEAKRQEAVLQVTTAYYGLLTADRLVKVAEEAVTGAEGHLAVVRANFAAGTVLKTDVLRTEVALGQARQNLIKARNGRELARLGLATTLGLPGETDFRLVEPAKAPPPGTTLQEDLEKAYRRRPDLVSARAQFEVGRAGRLQAQSGLLPSVALVASEDWQGSQVDNLDGSWTVMLNASLNVFDWGAARARVKQAEDSLAGLELRLKGLEDQLRLEVSQARQAVAEAEQRLPLAQTTLEQAKENLELTRIRYEAGLATTVDILDGQTLLTQSEAAQVQALYDYNLALAKLAKATGETSAK